jgi:hypothetical protein
LCSRRRDIPPKLHEFYRKNDDGQYQPTHRHLIEMLHVLAEDSPIYLIIDALDESSEWEELLETITKDLDGMNILVTSRREQDMIEFLDDVADITISLSGSKIDNDIELHIRKRLGTDRTFRTWPSGLKSNVEQTLVEKADGMYILWILKLIHIGFGGLNVNWTPSENANDQEM